MNTIFKIKRFSVLREEQKEFTIKSMSDLIYNGNNKYFHYYQPCLNIMKLIEMFYAYLEKGYNDDREHWLDMVMKSFEETCGYISPLTFFVWLESDQKILYKILGTNEFNEFSKDFNNSVDYINFIKNHLLLDTKNSEPKYKNWFKKYPFERTLEEYLYYFKYIALCVSGQLTPEIDNLYESSTQRKVYNTKINYERNLYPNKTLLVKLRDIIYKCIKNIVFYEED